MSYTVALTGGIGSGKSAVADAFFRLKVNVIDADIIARQVVEPGTSALCAISGRFGPAILNEDGSLNRRRLRSHIFSCPEDKAWLNALLHPLIQQRTRRQIQAATSPYLIWVIPLLVENRLFAQADRILVVDVARETQIQRTMLRDSISRQQVEHILAAQATREQRLAVADDVIENTGSADAIAPAVARLHEKYLLLASQAASQEKP